LGLHFGEERGSFLHLGSGMMAQISTSFVLIVLRGFQICALFIGPLFEEKSWGGKEMLTSELSYGLGNDGTN